MIVIMSHNFETLFHQSRSVYLGAGQVLFRIGAPVSEMFLVRSGIIHLCRHTLHGAEMVLQRAFPDAVVAEASAYSDSYHCDAVAAIDSVVQALPKGAFLAALEKDTNIATAWAAMLARGVQAARLRSEIRTLPKVADRLDAWLGEGNSLPNKGHWQDVASELGVTREALYRELAHRRQTSASDFHL